MVIAVNVSKKLPLHFLRNMVELLEPGCNFLWPSMNRLHGGTAATAHASGEIMAATCNTDPVIGSKNLRQCLPKRTHMGNDRSTTGKAPFLWGNIVFLWDSPQDQ